MKKQDPPKRQTPAEKRTAVRIQKKLDRPDLITKPKHQRERRGSPKTTWDREGRDPTWAKDRKELMKIFNRNIEEKYLYETSRERRGKIHSETRHRPRNVLMPRLEGVNPMDALIEKGARISPFHPLGLRVSKNRNDDQRMKENQFYREYYATGLGPASRAMRQKPVYLHGQESVDYMPHIPMWDVEGKSTRPAALWEMQSDASKPDFEYRDDVSIALDYNRDKSFDTPAIAERMAHYDKLHSALQKQDKAVRSLSNAFKRGILRRR